MEYKYFLIGKFVATHLHHGEILHGHNFKCIAHFALQDEEYQKKIFYETVSKINYVNLNEIEFFKENTPSTENIALFIFNKLKECKCKTYSVEVFETEDASGGVYKC